MHFLIITLCIHVDSAVSLTAGIQLDDNYKEKSRQQHNKAAEHFGKFAPQVYVDLLPDPTAREKSELGMKILELFSFVLEIPNDRYITLSQNLIGCSTLSQEYCKLIG